MTASKNILDDVLTVARMEKKAMLTGLTSECAPIQMDRRHWKPVLPDALRAAVRAEQDDSAQSPEVADAAILAQQFPNTWGQKCVKLVADLKRQNFARATPLRIGVVLSGGQAAGGHNVIAGVFDYIKQCHPESTLIGFKSGPHGIFTHNYMEITPEFLDKYRNMGGFDMICSGRHKIETEEQKKASMEICQKLELHGLVIIGGDDSNTNGAVLAEYFKANNCKTLVAGAPKTIDGDLKNEYIEISFGFDTAIKTYSELVGNLCEDVRTNKDRYHFIRLMGRSATNIGLEVMLQTRANLCFVGEEIQRDNRSLSSICNEIADMVEKRHKMGRDYGVVLLPEGLIEFIPEVGTLISEINDILGDGSKAFDENLLSANSKSVFKSLPESIRAELLLERDSHGNVQVAKIATERLLILMTQAELARRNYKGQFVPNDHYFGYEGRCAMPSNFDANYCYALGHTAGALIDNGLTGYMAVVRNLHRPSSQWVPGGCPVTMMMNVERRKGKDVPVIKKYLVELDKTPFTTFKEIREVCKTEDLYRIPGPIQFEGASADITNFLISHPSRDLLLGKEHPHESGASVKSASSLYEDRMKARLPEVTPECGSGRTVGVCCIGPALPGARNVLASIVTSAKKNDAHVTVFRGVDDLVNGKGCEVQTVSPNIGGFEYCSTARLEDYLGKITESVKKVDLMVFLGDERALNQLKTLSLPKTVFIPMCCDQAISHQTIQCNLGFDTISKTYAGLVGNLLTDAASAHKYWYFVRVMGGPALALEIAAQTHVNHVVIDCQPANLNSVARDIASSVKARAAAGKNFGCVLIPNCVTCCTEPMHTIISSMDAKESRESAIAKVQSAVSSWPDFARNAIMAPTPDGRFDIHSFPVDQLLAHLVSAELKKESFTGAFAPVTYYMGLQARSAMPSAFDSKLGSCMGNMVWQFFDSPEMVVASVSEVNSDRWVTQGTYASQVTACNGATVDHSCPSALVNIWSNKETPYRINDIYCNPGPVQFSGRYNKMVAQLIVLADAQVNVSEDCKKLQQTPTDASESISL